MKKYKFSLIELAVVMVIVGIIVGISAPSFVRMSKGKKVQSATTILGAKLKAARAYAITNNKYVAVIFTQGTSTMSEEYRFRSYRPCIVTQDNNFVEWIPDEKWSFLPKGVYITSLITDKIVTIGNTNLENTIGYQGGTEDQNLEAVIFKPTGDITGNMVKIQVREAVYTSGYSEPTPKLIQAAIDEITIDNLTGRVYWELITS